MLDNTKPYVEKIHYIDAELAGVTYKLRECTYFRTIPWKHLLI